MAKLKQISQIHFVVIFIRLCIYKLCIYNSWLNVNRLYENLRTSCGRNVESLQKRITLFIEKFSKRGELNKCDESTRNKT